MNEKYSLDVKDKKILAELDTNARQSNSQIGKKVKLSKEVIKYRIDKMIEAGIIPPVIKVGNSAGVLVPRNWLNGSAKVELVSKPLDIKKDIFNILEPFLSDIVGIYLIGSHARGEANERSDVDLLVITEKENKNITNGKYSIILISKDNVERNLDENILPILPMLKEAKPILNSKLIEKYKKTELTRKNLNFYIETGKSAMKMNKGFIELANDEGSKLLDDDISYSLILRLRSSYIIDCLIKNKKWTNKEFLNLIKKITGSLISYEGYLRKKDDKPLKEELPVADAERLHDYILKKIKEHEKWVKTKKSGRK